MTTNFCPECGAPVILDSYDAETNYWQASCSNHCGWTS